MEEKSNSMQKQERVTEGLFYSGERENNANNPGKRRCMGCMELCEKEERYCPHCGYDRNAQVEQPLHMLPGTILKGKYQIGKVLGYGGFGVTYIGWDMLLERRIAVKEYLPSEFATRGYGQTQVTVFSGDKANQFADGRRKFVEEAKRLAKFHSESGIVKIYDSFEENETAYIVMEYLDGETLAEFIEREKRIPAEKAVEMMMPVIESLNVVHEAGIIHRDIAPDNIILTKNGEVKLIDFGAARYATTTRSRSLTVIIKPGYSAEEQYRSKGDQGTHTDVYSVGAVLYKLITGETPPDALQRRAYFEKSGKDILKPIRKTVKDVPKNIETAIYNAMNVRIEDRTPDMINLAGELLSENPVKRRDGRIKKIDILAWPLWAKIGVPTGVSLAVILSVLLALGVIGPRAKLKTEVDIPDGMTMIPDIVAYGINEAEKELKGKNLSLLIGEKEENDNIEENLVLVQSPDAGNIAAMGSFINVTISGGVSKEYVVDVKDYTLELAKKELEGLGFVIETKVEYNSEVAPGAVISQSVQAGEALAKGSVITLVISKGAENVDTTKTATIPNVIGMNLDKAKAEAKKQNLYVSISEIIYDEKIPEGQITKQTPEGNTSGHQGDTIKVTVNMGIKTIYMPDVMYRTQTDAIEKLRKQGMTVKVIVEENRDVAAGIVFEQSIAAGERVEVSTIVVLKVSKGYIVTVPNVTGQAMNKAQKTLMGAGLASTVTYKSSSTVPEGYVISQSLKEGIKVNQGTTVELTVSSGTRTPESQKYIITVSRGTGISSISGAGSYAPGTNVTITASVSEGYNFIGWDSSNANLLANSTSISYTFKMPAGNITLTANAVKKGNIIASGKCGNNANWSLDSNGLLNITGKGDIYDYENKGSITTPWYKYNSSIKNAIISEGITCIGSYMFAQCTNLTSVRIPSSVTNIKNYAFWHCGNLKTITIPDNVVNIGVSAFNLCSNLSNITIPKNVNSIGQQAFSYCTSLVKIDVNSENKNYTSEDGVLFNKAKTKLIICPAGISDRYIVPDGVEIIGESAFSGCKSITEIIIPNGVTALETEAFAGCTALKNVVLSDTVKKIGTSAFYYCVELENITIPKSVIAIGTNAFSGCNNIKSIELPSSVASVGSKAFYGWTSSQTIYVQGYSKSPTGWDTLWDYDCNAKIVWNA